MKKRMISLFLALVTLLGILPVTSFAAPTLEEAMAEVNVYAKNETLNWLTMNGSVKEQHYTYYKYESVQTGQVKEIPAYCVDPKLYGVPVKVPEGTPIKYSAKETMSDYKLVGIVSNGYPHQSLETLGLKTVNEGYYATKTAVWIHILGNWSIDKLGINPNLSGADREAAERVLQATKDIYWRGVMWNKMYTPKLTATADRDKAYPVTINGEAYYQQEFTVRSETWAIESVKLSLGEGAPAGAKILDKDNKEITSLVLDTNSDDGFYNTCKVVYPASSVEGQTGSVTLNMSCVVDQYVVYYAKTLEKDKYGNIQDYLLDTDPSYPIEASAISQYSADPDKPDKPDDPPDSSITQLKITKLETGTETPLEGAVFEVLYPDGKPVGSYSTNANGVITIPLSITGNYTVTEQTPPKFHVLPKHTTQNVTVMHGKTAELTFWNDPYGSLRVHKVSDTGDNLAGVTIQIKHVKSGETWTEKTNQAGVAVFNELPLGGYEVREMAGIEGWIAETDTVQTVAVVAGEESTATIVNKALPGLKIIKYDRTTLKVMADIPFEIWRDGVSLGQHTTNAQGEILITNAQPGTYLVREVQSDDEHVTDTTPQQVELKPGDGIKELVFYNGKKPGIRLVKVDSANLSKPLPNVKFSIRAVDGTFGPKEFTTDENGEIDLSKLSPGAYEVTELECPGYVIDQAQRIIQLEADQTAEFVFTNSKKPDLLLKKVSSDGKPLAGVSFRLAKIEDGSRYLDRTTNAQGEILWEGLEPGVYSLRETATTADHILDLREYHVELFPGKVSTICIENQERPNLTVWKRDADTGEVVPNTVFLVKAADGHSVNEVRTGPDGKGTLENLLPGVYEISEKSVPEPYLQDAANQLVTLYPNKSREVLFENHKRPSIEIIKENSITHERQAHVPFQVWYASNNTSTGEYNDLGVFYTDENGRIVLTEPDIFLRDGWFRVKELEAPHGFALADPDTQEAFIPSGTSHTFLFQDRPLSAICVWKYDSVSPNMAIEGAVFQIRYLSGNTSGTGGTVIGTYRTGQNGSFTATGLPAGTYVIEELSSDGDHVIDTPPQTVYLSGNDQEVIQVHFGNSPKGSLMVKKVDSITKQPLSDVEFSVTDSKGNVVGDANGKFVTDSTGSFTVSGIDPSTTLIVKEIRAKDGYILDDMPQTAVINAGQTVTLEFRNQPLGSLLIRKVCSVNPCVTLANAEFKVTYSDGALIGNSNGVYRSDENGEVRIDGLIPGKSVVVTETKAPAGFLIDAQPQTIVIQAGKTVTVTMKNQPRGKLIIQKRDSQTNQVLPGAQFRITTAAGCEVGLDGVIGTATLTSNGIFTTDSQGEIRISNLAPGAYVISEIKAPDNYVMDNPSTNVVIGPNGDTQTVIVTNTPKATLTILKRDAVTKKPLANAEFIVRDSEGHTVGPTNGIYKTGTDGTVVVSGLVPGATIMVSETKAPSGYILDETPKHIVVKSGISNSLIFDDEPGTTLIIQKFIEGTANEPLAGVAFKVVDGSGAAVGPDDGVYYTDHAGEIVLNGIEPGTTVKAREIKTVDGFVLDGTPQDILIKGGEVQRLTFWNQRAGTLVLQKKDSVSGSFISGAQFQLTYANGGFVDNDNGHLSSNGLYTTDERGEIRISGITGTVVAKEVKAAPGYVIDQSTQTQTVTVNPLDTQTLVFLNEPLCSLTLRKLDATNGKPVPNTEFTLKDGDGNVLGRYTTGADGTVTVTGLIPNSTVVVVETRVPSNYVLDPTPRTIIVRNGSNSVASGGTGNGGNISGGNTGGSGGSGSNDVTVENLPKTTLTIEKYLETDTGEQPLKGVTFLVTDSSGAVIGSSNGEFTSDENGRVVIPNLEPGITVTAKEIRVPDGVVLDPTPKSIKIEGGIGGQTLRFVNQRAGNLILNKVDGIDKHPLSGVRFKITYADGSNVDQDGGKTSSNGIYTSDENGQIKISNVVGTVKIMEIETIPGYYIDEKYRTQTVEIKPNDTQTITVYNVPTQALVIQKFVTGSKDQPLAGVEFLVTDSDGTVLGPNNGIYKTDQFGRITIKGLTPGTVITARETKTLGGYVLDSTPQSIEIKSGEVQTMTFYNAPIGGLELIKVSEADKTQRIKGVTFEIRKMDGALVDTVTTGDRGRVHVSLDAGDYYCVEVEAAEGFKLDSTPHYFTIRDNETTTLTVTNAPFSGILLHKVDSATKEGIYGATFLLYDANKNPIGQYSSDDRGYVYIENLTTAGRYYLRELENEGYIVDTQLKTVYVTPGTTTEITWENTAVTGQIQIFKTSADYNSMNGWPAGTPIPGTEFEIYHYRTGNLVDTVRTDKNGVAVSKPLPLGRYKVVESKAADFYGLDKTPIEVEIEHAGQIVKTAMTNKALYTNVSIKKSGFVEVMPGQQIRYDFSSIANNSTTALTSFYWRDTLPTQAVRLDKIVTGTYNVQGNYKIVFKTNLNGEYRTMYDNLSTMQNYVLDASPAALGLASDEYVTEFMVSFGIVPGSFRQVEAPRVYCNVVSWLTGGTQFVNQADVGGVYNGQWIMATSRWVTRVYKPATPLPRTGY
ncbi:SpaA isopeptide-forming pilin-related protein [Flintibacter muris]|uniref:SpaA isopeptide-forming pilin-related protein n=1 Tax=Flintibacter muris TaxID=2941327 RepID=UPI0020425AF4|nr:SpaA isopeptide-forming pilin-related protein [Flintibacter muris]